MSIRKTVVALAIVIVACAMSLTAASATHDPGVVVETAGSGDCGQTTISAVVLPNADHVQNMYLVVSAGGVTESANIPTDGNAASVTVGPFFTQSGEDVSVLWRVFGGGERNFDDPHWNGYGGATFGADIGAYAAQVGGYGWTIAGPDDPNLFTTWNVIAASSCGPVSKDDCKIGSWELYGFRNQGDCVSSISANGNSGA
jgi:hypothetical protein